MNKQTKRGFTILETLVAIGILGVAMAAAISVTQKALNAAVYAKEEMTASYLAAEGIELVKNHKDSHILAGDNWLYDISENNSHSGKCGETGDSDKKCFFDVSNPNLNPGLCSLNTPFGNKECPTLKINETTKLYAPDMSDTSGDGYIREIVVKNVPGDSTFENEAEVIVTVWWRHKTESVTIVENIYRWF